MWRPAVNYWVTAARGVPLSANQGLMTPSFFWKGWREIGERVAGETRSLILILSLTHCSTWSKLIVSQNLCSVRAMLRFLCCPCSFWLRGTCEHFPTKWSSKVHHSTGHQGWAWLSKSVAGFLCWTSQFFCFKFHFIGDSKSISQFNYSVRFLWLFKYKGCSHST